MSRLNPQFPSLFGVSYVQPLFRGRTIDLERRQILISRAAADLTDSQLSQVVMDQLTLVEQAYWDLAFAVRNLDVQATALSQAQAQVASNERQAQRRHARADRRCRGADPGRHFRYSIASAQQSLTEAENRLKTLMLTNRQDDLWNQALQPTEPAARQVAALPLGEAMTLALERRPELASIANANAQNEIDRALLPGSGQAPAQPGRELYAVRPRRRDRRDRHQPHGERHLRGGAARPPERAVRPAPG